MRFDPDGLSTGHGRFVQGLQRHLAVLGGPSPPAVASLSTQKAHFRDPRVRAGPGAPCSSVSGRDVSPRGSCSSSEHSNARYFFFITWVPGRGK